MYFLQQEKGIKYLSTCGERTSPSSRAHRRRTDKRFIYSETRVKVLSTVGEKHKFSLQQETGGGTLIY